ncbi:MAG: TnsA endonuclease N-terminal domain-containing protein [Nitrospiraceae bacterium]|nr:TnsA endonuclease N-terminal domain-containing protein [Nitrospiraceae bacterium]
MRKTICGQKPIKGDASAPVWKQLRGSYGSNFWQMYSWKLDRDVHFYSSLERDHGVIVEADPTVASFCEQPLRIKIKLDGRDRETVMDMLIQFTDGRTEYREIKYVNDVQAIDDHSRVSRQLAAQREWAFVTANDYKVVTDEEIRRNPTFLRNWKQILAYLATYASYDLSEIEHQLLAAFDIKPSWSLKDLERHLAPQDRQAVKASIFRLIHGGLCTAPLDVYPLTNSIAIQRGTK